MFASGERKPKELSIFRPSVKKGAFPFCSCWYSPRGQNLTLAVLLVMPSRAKAVSVNLAGSPARSASPSRDSPARRKRPRHGSLRVLAVSGQWRQCPRLLSSGDRIEIEYGWILVSVEPCNIQLEEVSASQEHRVGAFARLCDQELRH